MNILRNKSNIIEYTVNKESNNGIYISVQNGEVLVNVPWYVSSNQIQEIVKQKRKWILEKITEYEMQNKNQKKFGHKDIQILGKEYKLNIKYIDIKLPEANISKDEVEILLPNKYKKVDNTKIIKLIINKIYNSVAEKEIENCMEKARVMLGFAPEDYKIEKMKNTIGKCEDNVITINPDIVIWNREIIEYVVVHEYCHLKYKTHSKKFNEMIQKYIPNYKEIENQIKQYKY